jgi:hypothetical protein
MPNVIVLAENGGEGHWIHSTSDVDEMYSQLLYMPDAEKTNWLKTMGANYKSHDTLTEGLVYLLSRQVGPAVCYLYYGRSDYSVYIFGRFTIQS